VRQWRYTRIRTGGLVGLERKLTKGKKKKKTKKKKQLVERQKKNIGKETNKRNMSMYRKEK
jgi:hypothetical protein